LLLALLNTFTSTIAAQTELFSGAVAYQLWQVLYAQIYQLLKCLRMDWLANRGKEELNQFQKN
jgi:hypothetical protein